MADIVLIHPYIGEMDSVRDKPHLPLPLIQAAVLAEKEFNVRLLDLRLITEWQAVIDAEIAKKPLFFAFSVMSGRPVFAAWEVADYIKQRCETPIVWGGHHPTLDQENTLKDPAVDIIVIGEGEVTLLELARRIADGQSLEGVNGVWFKNERGETVKNPPRESVNFDDLPLPPYHLVDVEKYIQVYRGKRMVNLETSRGCVFKCTYCYHSAINSNHRFRFAGVEKSLERIFWARDNLNVDGVYLVDDNFFLDKDRGNSIVEELARQKKPFYWQIQGVDVPSMLRFDGNGLKQLEKSGLQRISVGAESGSPKILRYVKKPHTVEMLLRANRIWSAADINVFYSFVSGFPPETVEDIYMTIDTMFRLTEENPHARTSPVYNFLPFPGSTSWKVVIEEFGYQPPKTLKDWKDYDWNRVNVPYLSAEMKAVLSGLYWPTLFLDRKFEDYEVQPLVAAAAKFYRPLAHARLKTRTFSFPLEGVAAGLAEKALSASRKRAGQASNKRDIPWTL
jgi:anaerobic magnesium-protoporphyrin IX monomethyl ester cyclase